MKFWAKQEKSYVDYLYASKDFSMAMKIYYAKRFKELTKHGDSE